MDSNDKKAFEILKTHIKKNDVCIDIGANTGIYTDFLLRELKGTGKVYSIELFPETYEILISKFNHWPNIELINCAANNFDGMANYFYGRDSCTHNIIGHDMDYNENSLVGQIKSMKIDTIVENENQINFIKLDVEGAEISVLRGMEKTLPKTDLILLECHLDKDWPEVAQILMIENDFELYDLISGEQIKLEDKRPYLSICKNKKTRK